MIGPIQNVYRKCISLTEIHTTKGFIFKRKVGSSNIIDSFKINSIYDEGISDNESFMLNSEILPNMDRESFDY